MCMLTASYPTRNLQVWEKRIGMLLVSEILLANTSSSNKDGVGFGTLDGGFVKWECSAGDIVFTKEYNEMLRQMVEAPFIAHVRAISTGVGAKDGAHPFKVDNILLAHNGTFTNYRTFLGKYANQINDTNPVDSHVITHMLAEKVGSGELKPEHLASVLSVAKGSFALLITDAVTRKMWVVTGSNPLHIHRSGPLWLINTSRLNLINISSSISGAANLLYDKDWDIGDITRVEGYTINLLSSDGLTKVADLDKPTQTTYHYHGYTRAGETKKVSTKDARTRAEWADIIINLPGISRVELTLACFVLLETEWWKADMECLEVLYATLEKISSEFGSSLKDELWAELMVMTKYNAYAVIAAYTDIAFPYMLNSVEMLRGFAKEIRQDLKDGNTLPSLDD